MGYSKIKIRSLHTKNGLTEEVKYIVSPSTIVERKRKSEVAR
jgi:hypothetical protein